MKITVEFDTDNAAFEDNFSAEVQAVMERAKLLVKCVAHKHREDPSLVGEHRPLFDTNGNTIGKVTADTTRKEWIDSQVCSWCHEKITSGDEIEVVAGFNMHTDCAAKARARDGE